MNTIEPTGKDAQYQKRLSALQPYEDWARENPITAKHVTADRYMQLSHDQIVREVYGNSGDPRKMSWLGDGKLRTDATAPWYALTSLPGGYGAYPTNPTTLKVLGAVAISVGALLAWGGQLDKAQQPERAPVPAVRK